MANYWEGKSRKLGPTRIRFRPPELGTKFRTKKISGTTQALAKRGNYGGSKENWAEIRAQVLARDGHKCTSCGKTRKQLNPGERLEIHHIRRISRGGVDLLPNLTTLCSRCHSMQDGHSHLQKKRIRHGR